MGAWEVGVPLQTPLFSASTMAPKRDFEKYDLSFNKGLVLCQVLHARVCYYRYPEVFTPFIGI